MTTGEATSPDDLSVRIQWPRGQDERIAAAKPSASPPVATPTPGEPASGGADVGPSTVDDHKTQLRLLFVAVSELGARVDAMAAQLELVVDDHISQTASLERLAAGRDVLAADRDVLAAEVRTSLAGMAQEIRQVKRRLALRSRADGELDDEAVKAVADAVLLGLDDRIGRGLDTRVGWALGGGRAGEP